MGIDRRALLAVALAAGVGWVQDAGAAEGRKMSFGGHVRETVPREKWFVMNGGSSKKYAQVKIRYDAGTKWSGLPRKGGVPAVGAPVRVECTEQKDGSWRAVSVWVQDPKDQPTQGGVKTMPR